MERACAAHTPAAPIGAPVKLALPGPYLLARTMWMECISDRAYARDALGPVGTLLLEMATPRAGDEAVREGIPRDKRVGLGAVDQKLEARRPRRREALPARTRGQDALTEQGPR